MRISQLRSRPNVLRFGVERMIHPQILRRRHEGVGAVRKIVLQFERDRVGLHLRERQVLRGITRVGESRVFGEERTMDSVSAQKIEFWRTLPWSSAHPSARRGEGKLVLPLTGGRM